VLRKTCIAALAALALTGCGGDAPVSYMLRSDLCEVLDYQAFSRSFGSAKPGFNEGVPTDAKIVCVANSEGFTGNNLTIRTEAFKYESPEEAKKVFDRRAKAPSDLNGAKLKTDVDDSRLFMGYRAVVLDSDLYLQIMIDPRAVDDSSFKDEMPRLDSDFTDQVLERLREKS